MPTANILKVKQDHLVPEELRLRKELEDTGALLYTLDDEGERAAAARRVTVHLGRLNAARCGKTNLALEQEYYMALAEHVSRGSCAAPAPRERS